MQKAAADSLVGLGNPVSDTFFASRMGQLGPFEEKPHVAVAVSGGADSLALSLLAFNWVNNKGGKLTALTVDHGLRESVENEIEFLRRLFKDKGIDHYVLSWREREVKGGIQSAARKARYNLLEACCKRLGIFHLLLAHQRDDQAETMLMRLLRGCHPLGLSGINAIRETYNVRLLRPLLTVPKIDLVATLCKHRINWCEDPYNSDFRFTRTRVRHALKFNSCASQRIADSAPFFQNANRTLDSKATFALIRAVSLFPEGFANLSKKEISSIPPNVLRRILLRVIMTVGGQNRYPQSDALKRLASNLTQGKFKGTTLGGCLFLNKIENFIACREYRNLPSRLKLVENKQLYWDGRFDVRTGLNIPSGSYLAALGTEGWEEISQGSTNKLKYVPRQARETLPAVFDKYGVREVPQLNFHRENREAKINFDTKYTVFITYRPRVTLSGKSFGLV
ncbi:MAG: tRNA(Ile)-lysidine synthase [Alphaproteobacteria bacterium MarineAlpha3_Bin5]|nr:MAG: tRNA(Ile)-lysidine synthase [Alphaproteobacteria bacterium MarineAlpha3_Bin5]